LTGNTEQFEQHSCFSFSWINTDFQR